MINRCKYCGEICPDFSDVCDTCNVIVEDTIGEEVANPLGEKKSKHEEMENERK